MIKYRYLFLLLGVVSVFIGSFLNSNIDRSLGLLRIEVQNHLNKGQLKTIANYLHSYRSSTGHYPSNDEGLLALKKLQVDARSAKENQKFNYPLHKLKVSGYGVLSPWGEPYIYENRQGLNADKFTDSGANSDKARAYSIQVDKGIYVWSVAAQQKNEFLATWQKRLNVLMILMISIAIIFFGLYVINGASF